jgi:RNA polymerase sigma-70 factor (ECF subfamily)
VKTAAANAGEPVDLRVARAARGDVAAFEALYREHVGRVYALCLRLCADPRQAEECAQRAFVTAWQKLGTYRGEAAFGSWLCKVAVNVVRMDQRAGSRLPFELDATGAPEGRNPTPPHPGERVDLERAIATLPEGARQVLVLHDVEGWPHEDIAAALGVTVGTTKSQLHRARALLREALGR